MVKKLGSLPVFAEGKAGLRLLLGSDRMQSLAIRRHCFRRPLSRAACDIQRIIHTKGPAAGTSLSEDMKRTKGRRRIARERHTVEAMIALYCRLNHHGGDLCHECRELNDYAAARLANCPFGDDKPTCLHCRIHCYTPRMRERIGEVMRFSGPRMIRRHPVLAIRHLVDGYLDEHRQKDTSKKNGETHDRKGSPRKDGN